MCSNGCGKPIFSKSAKAKYCSILCAHARYKMRTGSAFCPPCLNACGRTVASSNKKYCSPACQQAYQFNIRCLELEAGRYNVVAPNKLIRRYLVRKFGEKCSQCGWDRRHPLTGRVPIEVEHIDGNWQNNHLSNLTLLCPNCHSLTRTFRGLNRGKGRPYRLGGRQNPLGTGPLSREQKSSVAKLPAFPAVEPGKRFLQLDLSLPT